MFEHLVSQHHKDFISQKPQRVKLYASLLLLSIFVFTSAWLSVNQGPKSSAQSQDIGQFDRVKVFTANEPGNSQFVLRSPSVAMFDFVLESPYENVTLNRLVFSSEGTMDENFLSKLVLYQNQAQISASAQVINKKLIFTLDSYPLSAGKNYFHLNADALEDDLLGQKTKIFFQDIDSLDLSYQGKKVVPLGSFPVSSTDVLIVEKAQILPYNNLLKNNFVVSAGVSTKIADFSLSSQGETVDLQKINFIFSQNEKPVDFYLASKGQVLSRVTATSELDFSLPAGVLIKANEDLPLELWATMEPGEHTVTLNFISGKGFVSGEQINFTEDITLSRLNVLPSILSIQSQAQRRVITDSWNTIAELKFANLGGQDIKLHKLAWQINAQDIQVESFELWSQDKFLASSKIVNDQIIFTFWGDASLLLAEDLNVQLIAKIAKTGSDARLTANFLTDHINIQPENVQNNFLWSVEDKLYNSYLLPGLPLTPVILE